MASAVHQRADDRPVSIAGFRGCDTRRHGLIDGRRRRAHRRGELADQIGFRQGVGRNRKHIVEAARIEESDLRAGVPHGGLADAMRQQGHFMAQIRADHEHAVEAFYIRDLDTEIGESRLAPLSAKIQLAQSMIDIGAAQSARDLRQQVQLLDGGHRRAKESRGGPAVRGGDFLQAFRRRGERDLPVDGLERAVDA